jgi:hypothetical protein
VNVVFSPNGAANRTGAPCRPAGTRPAAQGSQAHTETVATVRSSGLALAFPALTSSSRLPVILLIGRFASAPSCRP